MKKKKKMDTKENSSSDNRVFEKDFHTTVQLKLNFKLVF